MTPFASTWSSTASMLLCLSAFPAIADEAPCTCPDMLDLASRNNQVKAAMQSYQEQLAAWTAGAPGADEESRTAFQLDIVEPSMVAAKDSRANTASAEKRRPIAVRPSMPRLRAFGY